MAIGKTEFRMRHSLWFPSKWINSQQCCSFKKASKHYLFLQLPLSLCNTYHSLPFYEASIPLIPSIFFLFKIYFLANFPNPNSLATKEVPQGRGATWKCTTLMSQGSGLLIKSIQKLERYSRLFHSITLAVRKQLLLQEFNNKQLMQCPLFFMSYSKLSAYYEWMTISSGNMQKCLWKMYFYGVNHLNSMMRWLTVD